MNKWISGEWGVRIISFILAVGLWYYAVGEEGMEVTRTIPLEIKVKNAQMSILQSSVHSVQVTLFAPRALLSDLTSSEIRAKHEISADINKAGDYSFRLEPREINLPSLQIRVAKIEPEFIKVTLDEVIVQKAAVKPNFMGDPAFGYSVAKEEIELNPNAVLIEGPKGQVEKLDGVLTERIDLVGRTRSFRRTVTLELPQNVKLLSESLIDLYVPIREEFDEKRYEKIPVKILNDSVSGRKVEIKPSEISFTLKGAKKQFEKLTPEQLTAYVDATHLEPGETELPVQLLLPEGVSLKDKPVLVKVSVSAK